MTSADALSRIPRQVTFQEPQEAEGEDASQDPEIFAICRTESSREEPRVRIEFDGNPRLGKRG